MTRIRQRNAADESQVKAQEAEVKRLRKRELDDLRAVLMTKEGRRFIYRVINGICHYDAKCFDHSGSVTNFILGERNVGRVLKSDACEASYEHYQLAERENWTFLKGEENE